MNRNRGTVYRIFSVLSRSILTTVLLSYAVPVFAGDAIPTDSSRFQLDYRTEVIANYSSGHKLAPYYVVSNRNGIVTQASNLLINLELDKEIDTAKRFDYGFGIEGLAGVSSAMDYLRYIPEEPFFKVSSLHPAPIFLQQLYGELKYRKVFMEVGMKEHGSKLLDKSLSSGDLVESGNARAIPQVRIGFTDFVDVPLTNGWLQINGQIAYGKYADNRWIKNHYNYYNNHINLGGLYTYKFCYFRIAPQKPLSFTFGMQTAASFGGTTEYYRDGVMYKREKFSAKPKDFIKMFLPIRGKGNEYYEGSSLGSWDILFRYRFNNGSTLKAYLEKPWEDGTGIGWMNGLDGLYGLEWQSADHRAFITGAVVEYIDFTNQSGSVNFAQCDHPGTNLSSEADGGDQYYNNYASNAYAYYGMSIGTPFLPAPIYNSDGYPAFIHNRIRGFHAAVEGRLSARLGYRVMGSYRKGWGDSRISTSTSPTDTSYMIEAKYSSKRFPGLEISASIASDFGSMLGNRSGFSVSFIYKGKL